MNFLAVYTRNILKFFDFRHDLPKHFKGTQQSILLQVSLPRFICELVDLTYDCIIIHGELVTEPDSHLGELVDLSLFR